MHVNLSQQSAQPDQSVSAGGVIPASTATHAGGKVTPAQRHGDATVTNDPLAMNGTWSVVKVWSGREVRLADQLLAGGIPYYLPIREEKRKYQGRWRDFRSPLFKGYLFTCLADDAQRYEIEDAHGDVHPKIIDVASAAQRQLAEQLHWLWIAQENRLLRAPWTKIVPGDRYEIIDGPFQGFKGTVIRVGGNHKIMIEIRYFEAATPVEIDPEFLEPASAEGD